MIHIWISRMETYGLNCFYYEAKMTQADLQFWEADRSRTTCPADIATTLRVASGRLAVLTAAMSAFRCCTSTVAATLRWRLAVAVSHFSLPEPLWTLAAPSATPRAGNYVQGVSGVALFLWIDSSSQISNLPRFHL